MKNKTAFFGELLVRLSPPQRRRMLQTDTLNLQLAGSELNVAAALAGWGEPTSFISALPRNSWAQWVLARMRQYGVGTEGVIQLDGRQGLFLLEEGQGLRASAVLYDRQHTALAAATQMHWPWQQLLANAAFFHFSGITPGVSDELARLTGEAVQEAAAAGCFISCDLNYRAKLWQYGITPDTLMPEMLAKANLLLAGPDAIEKMLGLSLDETDYHTRVLTPTDLQPIATQLFRKFPKLQYWAMSLRTTYSATDYQWQGYLCTRDAAAWSAPYNLTNCLDRVGTGDAFMAGLLRGLRAGWPLQQTVDFATAAGALKHYVAGDILLATTDEINALANNKGHLKINR